MLVLTRKKGQSIVIGDDIEVTLLDIQGDQIRLGIDAPRKVPVHRKEVFAEIRQENLKAATGVVKDKDKGALIDALSKLKTEK